VNKLAQNLPVEAAELTNINTGRDLKKKKDEYSVPSKARKM
jgi:hypothetical protein